MDPKLVASSRLVKIAGIGLFLGAAVAMIFAIANLAANDIGANITELVFAIFYSIGLVVAGVAALKAGISGTHLPAKIMFITLAICLVVYIIAFITSLMVMSLQEMAFIVPSVCNNMIASDTCQAAISMLAANWIELATSAFVVGVAMCGICMFIAYRQLKLTKDVDGMMTV